MSSKGISMKRLSFLIILGLIFTGCQNSSSNCPTTPYLFVTVQRVEQFYEAGSYEKQLEKITLAAQQEAAVAIEDAVDGEKLAAVFDIDDTCISLYPIQKEINFGYLQEFYEQQEKAQILPALKPTLRLYNYLKYRGVTIFFVTARSEFLKPYTIRNLKQVGYTGFERIYFFPTNKYQSIEAYKSAMRKMITNQGYTIMMTVGDQESDLQGPDIGIPVKLPNHIYVIQ